MSAFHSNVFDCGIEEIESIPYFLRKRTYCAGKHSRSKNNLISYLCTDPPKTDLTGKYRLNMPSGDTNISHASVYLVAWYVIYRYDEAAAFCSV